MTARLVVGGVELPSGVPCVDARIEARLYAGTAPTNAYDEDGEAIVGSHAVLSNRSGRWSMYLDPNDSITPTGTVWQLTAVRPGGEILFREYINVTTGSGSLEYSDAVSGDPGSLQFGALLEHVSSTSAHGATGAVVGTTNAQTLTNKTLTSPVISAPSWSDAAAVRVGLSAQRSTQFDSRDYATPALAFAAVNAAGGDLWIDGTHSLASALTVTQSNVRLFGAPGRSILRANGATTLLQSVASGSSTVAGLHVEGITFDMNGTAANGILLHGSTLDAPTIRGCEFINIGTNAVAIQGARHAVVEECVMWNPDGIPQGNGVAVTNGAIECKVRANRIEWVQNGVLVDTGAASSDTYEVSTVDIESNHINLWWPYLPVDIAGDGSTATYGADSLTDPEASFPAFSLYDRTVRAMVTLDAGVTSSFSQPSQLAATASTFVTDGVARGDIIRTATLWAVVESVQSETVLNLLGWRLLSAYGTVSPPPTSGTSFTIYRPLYCHNEANTATSITSLYSWHNLAGDIVEPPDGTPYEVCVSRANYPVHVELGARGGKIRDNRIRFGWSDSLSLYGTRLLVSGNTCSGSLDNGITINGTGHTVTGNQVLNAGSGGFSIGCSHSSITGNYAEGVACVNTVNVEYLAGFVLRGDDNVVTGNEAKAGSSPRNLYGFAIKGAADGNWITSNKADGFSTAGFVFSDIEDLGVNTALDNDGSIVVEAEAPAQHLRLSGSGVPTIAAAAGSTYTRSDGGNGSTLYVMEASGWAAK